MIKKFILFFTVILIFYFGIIHQNKENFEDNSKNKDALVIGRPWVNLFDQNGNIINVLLLSRPFFQSNDEDDYNTKIVPLIKKKKN